MKKPPISIKKMAWVFEQLESDKPIKAIAIDLNMPYRSLLKWIDKAERIGFDAWGQYAET